MLWRNREWDDEKNWFKYIYEPKLERLARNRPRYSLTSAPLPIVTLRSEGKSRASRNRSLNLWPFSGPRFARTICQGDGLSIPGSIRPVSGNFFTTDPKSNRWKGLPVTALPMRIRSSNTQEKLTEASAVPFNTTIYIYLELGVVLGIQTCRCTTSYNAG
jgi:hypothetical protein